MEDAQNVKSLSTADAPAAIGPYSQGMIAGENLLFISGQLPIDPDSGQLVEGDIKDKTERILKNIRAIARAAGTDLDHVVKTTVFLKDMQDFQAMNEIYTRYLGSVLPARSAIQVAGLPKDAEIEIEAIAYIAS